MPLETHGLKEDSFPQVRIIDCSPLPGKLLEKLPLTGSQNSGDSALCPASHMNWLHDPITDHSFHPDCFAGFLYQGHPQHRQSQTVVFVHAFHCLVACVLASHQEGSCQGTPSMTCWCQSAGFVWGGGEDQAVKTTMAWSYPLSSVMNFEGETIPCKRFLVPKFHPASKPSSVSSVRVYGWRCWDLSTECLLNCTISVHNFGAPKAVPILDFPMAL